MPIRKVIGLAREFKYISSGRLKMRSPVPEGWSRGNAGNVVLLPGFGDNFYFLSTIGNELNKMGYRIYCIDKFNTTVFSIERLAARVVNFLNVNDIENAILIGHSKGGLVAKYAMDHYPSINPKVSRIYTISTPYNGTIIAKMLSFLKFTEDFHPDSHHLKKLREETEANSKIINIYPTFDNVIFPSSSMRLDTALVNIEVNYIGHTGILKCPETILQIKTHLPKAE